MAQIFGFDIPPGLEDLFFKIFQFGDSISQTTLIKKTALATVQKKVIWSRNSLFVKWQDLYNGLSSARHIAWEAYWVTLPFGDHGGGGGWPGSGYSGFIYVNAPRYQLGQELLLDPPESLGPELVVNGDFLVNADGWELDYGANQFSFFDHGLRLVVNPLIDAYIRQNLGQLTSLTVNKTFRLQFDMSFFVGSGDVLYIRLSGYDSNGGIGYPRWFPLFPYDYNDFYPLDSAEGSFRHYSYDGILYSQDGDDSYTTLEIAFESDQVSENQIFITNISVRQVL